MRLGLQVRRNPFLFANGVFQQPLPTKEIEMDCEESKQTIEKENVQSLSNQQMPEKVNGLNIQNNNIIGQPIARNLLFTNKKQASNQSSAQAAFSLMQQSQVQNQEMLSQLIDQEQTVRVCHYCHHKFQMRDCANDIKQPHIAQKQEIEIDSQESDDEMRQSNAEEMAMWLGQSGPESVKQLKQMQLQINGVPVTTKQAKPQAQTIGSQQISQHLCASCEHFSCSKCLDTCEACQKRFCPFCLIVETVDITSEERKHCSGCQI